MSKKKKQQRSKKKKDRRPGPPAQVALRRLDEVEELIRGGRLADARDRLQAMERLYPGNEDVLILLGQVHHDLQEFGPFQGVAERLHRLAPNRADYLLQLAGAYLLDAHAFLALRAFCRFLERWPDHPRAAEARETLARLEATAPKLLGEVGLTGDDAAEVAALHEEVHSLLTQGKYHQAREVAERLLRLRPQFAPAHNNVGETWFREGRPDEAITSARRVLEFDPDNFHALSNVTRYLFLGGRHEEARQYADRLRAVQSSFTDSWVKKAEAFSLLGDDPAVLDALRGHEQAGKEGEPQNTAVLYHLAGVAAYRLDREDEARGHWRQALRHAPGFNLTQDNLDDLDRPVGTRHAPWPFNLAHWVSLRTVEALLAQVERAGRRGRDEAVGREVRRFLEAHPGVAGVVPALLDRGDRQGRELAFRVALMARTPALTEALRDFAFGRRGPDDLRVQAANAVCEAGLVPAGPTRMWLQGAWAETLLCGFELHGEPVHRHSPPVEELAAQAMEALYDGDGERAEGLLKRALEQEPTAPDLLNNLANAYLAQGREDEARALMREIHERDPDYLFGRVNVAQQHIERGELDRARELLLPLLSRRRLHFSELAALCMGQMSLFLAEGNRAAARQWLQLWENADPDHPQIPEWRERIEPQGWMNRLFSRRR
jgi:tetratricopeptide (TPR) repeat protein